MHKILSRLKNLGTPGNKFLDSRCRMTLQVIQNGPKLNDTTLHFCL